MFPSLRLGVLPFLLVLALAGCAAPAVDYRAGTDFGQYRTVAFRFAGEQPRSLDESRAESALQELLPGIGLRPVTENPDLVASVRFIPYQWYDADELFWRYDTWREPWGFGLHSPMIVRERHAVRMELELIDVAHHRVVWRAASAGGMESWVTGPARDRWIADNLKEMLAGWPR